MTKEEKKSRKIIRKLSRVIKKKKRNAANLKKEFERKLKEKNLDEWCY